MQAARPQRASRDTGHPGPAYGKADPEAMKAAALQRTLPGNWSPARASTAATAPSEVRTNLSQLGTHRVIRGAGGIGWRLRPRWSRCGGCRGTHVLLPVNWLEEAYGHPHPYTDALHYYLTWLTMTVSLETCPADLRVPDSRQADLRTDDDPCQPIRGARRRPAAVPAACAAPWPNDHEK